MFVFLSSLIAMALSQDGTKDELLEASDLAYDFGVRTLQENLLLLTIKDIPRKICFQSIQHCWVIVESTASVYCFDCARRYPGQRVGVNGIRPKHELKDSVTKIKLPNQLEAMTHLQFWCDGLAYQATPEAFLLHHSYDCRHCKTLLYHNRSSDCCPDCSALNMYRTLRNK